MGRYAFRPTKSLAERLEGKYHVDAASGCWLWIGRIPDKRPTKDYGTVFVSYSPLVSEGAHRVSWRVYRGEIPDGMNVLHRCDTPRCVNPEHLFLGTQDQNNKDRARKGRSNTGGKRAWLHEARLV